ncbi:MAG: cohesin domain-containing protein, partial [Pyrinomonadaceae bacterium]
PNVTPRDEEIRPSGSMQTPASETLEAMVREADREDHLAAARRLPTNQVVNLPPAAETVSYVPAPSILVDPSKVNTASTGNGAAQTTAVNALGSTSTPPVTPASLPAGAAPAPLPVSTGTGGTEKTEAGASKGTTQPVPAVTTGEAGGVKTGVGPPAAEPSPPTVSAAELRLVSDTPEMRVGEKRRLMLMLKTDAPLGLAAATFRFDPRVVAVRSVSPGTMFGNQSGAPVVTQSIDPKGVLLVSIAPPAGGSPLTGEGVLLFIEVEGVGVGETAVSFDAGKMYLIATDGRNILTQAVEAQLKVVQ